MPVARHTEDEKAEALSLYVDLGPAEAARRSGVSPLTISSWARRAGLHTNAPTKTKEATEALIIRAQSMREELKIRMLHKALDLLDRMDAPHVEFKGKDANPVTYPIAPAGAVQNYATSVAILLDKYRLESGEATERTENVSVTDGLSPDVKRRLRERIARSVRGESEDGPGTVSGAGGIGEGLGVASST